MQVADFMSQSYSHMRLAWSNQVPLEAVKPFLYFLEQDFNCRLDERRIFESIFRRFENRFAPMSQRTGAPRVLSTAQPPMSLQYLRAAKGDTFPYRQANALRNDYGLGD